MKFSWHFIIPSFLHPRTFKVYRWQDVSDGVLFTAQFSTKQDALWGKPSSAHNVRLVSTKYRIEKI